MSPSHNPPTRLFDLRKYETSDATRDEISDLDDVGATASATSGFIY